ncbi:cell wall-binding repeat-containing protein [Herbiconiux sp. CPCC 205763]|uniref:Cell wall-binding repeat-containing protein n=1 Tax=Herbiconiux aconitum TaxID=2970913 RepID=A0ABT2GS45_9MICO|nr:cell wall-binding repeat-containing protein [Herbiconiux aconitum]MCS5718983.1 cell wall-binding repeat-containing protein [Herbiconiux aconitum]
MRGRRWMRAKTGAAIAALLVVGGIATANPASANPASARTIDATAGPLQLGVPWAQTLDARWEPDPAAPLPSTTRQLSVVVPRALFDFQSTFAAMLGGKQRNPVTVTAADAATRTITVDIPEGYFATPEGQPGMASGSPRYSLYLQAARPMPDDIQLGPFGFPGEYRSSAIASIGFSAGGPGATDHSRTVVAVDASRYASESVFGIDPADELTAAAGETLTIVGGPLLDPGASATLSLGFDRDSVPMPVTVSPDAISLSVPSKSAMSGLLNRHAIVTVTGMGDRTSFRLEVPLTIVNHPTAGPGVTTRIAGVDRYAAAVAYSGIQFPPYSGSGRSVFLAAGAKYPDALSGAAAAAHVGGPLLLMAADSPSTVFLVGSAAQGAGASDIWTIGGPASVSYADSLNVAGLAGTTGPWRVEGEDRYEVSRRTADTFWPDGADTVFIATGENFPDALAAVPAAASQGAPVILVAGSQTELDQSTLAELDKLEPSHVVIVGGPVSVSPGIASQLGARGAGDVERITGSDRYEVATAVNRRFFPTAEEAFVATGATFADALAGGVLAASKHAPLLLVRPDCIPTSAHAALDEWDVSRTTLLGGPASLGPAVEDLVPCR